jgi:hypothetical protein
MPTLKEIYEGQSSWIFGTNYTSLKSDTETLVEQETSGIRIKSAVEVNNPLIYGNESTRIAIRSTPSVEKMRGATGGEGGDGGLIGAGLGAITGGGFGKAIFGGQVNSLSQARDGVNSKLGIPGSPIPTYVDGTGELQKGKEPDTMITLGKIKNDAAGTEFGKFLKQTGGGNFNSIGRNIIGEGISLVKDKLRDTLFGSPLSTGENSPSNQSYEYSSFEPYSSTIRNVKNNEPENDKLQLVQSQAKEKIDALKSKTKNLLKKNKKVDEVVEDKITSDDEPYSLVNEQLRVNDSTDTNLSVPSKESDDESKLDTNTKLEKLKPLGEKVEDKSTSTEETYSSTNEQLKVKDSRETNLSVPSKESDDEVKKDTNTKLSENKPLGEDVEDTSTSEEKTYRETVRDQQVDDREEGTFSRIDLSKIPGNNVDRKPKLFRTPAGPSDLGVRINNSYDDEVGYTSTVGKSSHEQKGLSSNNGDFINYAGVPQNGEYKDGDVVYSKAEMEALDLIPLWISGLDSSVPVFFRTLITGLTETVSPSWNSGNFVGNPYNYYTYTGVERNVSFSLNLYCMNQYELMKNWERVTYLTSKAYPTIKNNLVNPPFIKFRLGDIYNNKTGFIESLSYTMPDTGNWETETDGSLLPKFIDVSLTIKFVEVPGSELALYSYTKSEESRQKIQEELNSDTEESVSGAPVTNGGGGEQEPVRVDNKGQIIDSEPEESNSSQGNSKGVTNINTGEKEPTPKMTNDSKMDGTTIVTLSSEADTTTDERLKEIKKVVTDTRAAQKLSRRYSNPKRYLLELKKEKESVYYLKEELQSNNGNKIIEYAYKLTYTYGYGYPGGRLGYWHYQKWKEYLNEQGQKGESDALVSADIPGEEF